MKSQIIALWKYGTRRKQMDRELDEEIGAYVELVSAEKVRAGARPEEAYRAARRETGGVERVKQGVRDIRIGVTLERLAQDFRYGVRSLLRYPGFSMVAVATLALGISANTVIFTLVDSILLRPLPYLEQSRLMRITSDHAPEFPKGWVRALGENSRSFTSVAGFGADAEFNVVDSAADGAAGGMTDRAFGAKVTTNALDTLGIQPVLGEWFTADDGIAGQDREVILSYGYWRQHFDGAPGALGRSIRVDGVSRRVIGVLPAGVHFPYADTQLLVPVSFHRENPSDPWTEIDLQAFGRLAGGVTPQQAQAELRNLHGVLLPMFPWHMPDIWASDMTVVSLLEAQTGQMRPRLLLLFGAVGLILLIACANVANLMLARATARQREMAVRSALGGSGTRLMQQLLAESVVLGVAAGAVGLGAAFASLRIFVRLLPADTPRIEEVTLHAGDIVFTLGASIVAGLLFGLIPSIKMASMNLLSTLRGGGRGIASSGAGFGLSTALVVAQNGLSVMVIASAGLMLHSLYQLSRVDPGFRTSGTVTAEIALDAGACGDKGRCVSFYRTLLEGAQAIPGIEKVGLANALPLSGLDNNCVFDAEGHPRDARQGAMLATGRIVSPGYFDVLGLRLVRGRLLNSEDASGTSRAVVINERMAERLWPNQDPIGKHLLDVNDAPAPAVWDMAKASQVVGVVRNIREGSLAGSFNDEVYLPLTPAREQPDIYILLQSKTAPETTASGLRRAVRSIDAEAPVTRVRLMDEVVAGSVAAPRALAVLLLAFGCLGVVIGAVGVYSLISFVVGWRTPEIGLRLALGAQRWQIELSVVRQSMMLAAGGCVAGLLGTFALSRWLHSFLFEVSPLDPLTFCAVPVLMGVVAVAAAWVPARRAAAVDPMVALRGN